MRSLYEARQSGRGCCRTRAKRLVLRLEELVWCPGRLEHRERVGALCLAECDDAGGEEGELCLGRSGVHVDDARCRVGSPQAEYRYRLGGMFALRRKKFVGSWRSFRAFEPRQARAVGRVDAGFTLVGEEVHQLRGLAAAVGKCWARGFRPRDLGARSGPRRRQRPRQGLFPLRRHASWRRDRLPRRTLTGSFAVF